PPWGLRTPSPEVEPSLEDGAPVTSHQPDQPSLSCSPLDRGARLGEPVRFAVGQRRLIPPLSLGTPPSHWTVHLVSRTSAQRVTVRTRCREALTGGSSCLHYAPEDPCPIAGASMRLAERR